MIKYYVDNNGNYLGSFDGLDCPEEGAIEISSPPENGNQKWDGEKFLSYVNIQEQIETLENSITERNKREYVKGLKYPTDERFFYSTKKIDKVDADIELLRAEL